MKHLFVINPAAGKVKGQVDALRKRVDDFFEVHPDIPYDIYITNWCRDAVSYVRRYVTDGAGGPIRVHALGGPGTLYEVINAIAGLPEISVAAYPLGSNYHFLRYFAPEKSGLFASIEKQVFSRTIPIDLIRCGSNYAVNSSYIGLEAWADMYGDVLVEKGWKTDLSYLLGGLNAMFSGSYKAQRCTVEMDSVRIEGKFLTIGIANGPCYGNHYCPAPDAHPDDGFLDVYLVNEVSKRAVIAYIRNYLTGNYDKAPPGIVTHHRVRKLSVTSEDAIYMCIDGENFCGVSFEYELLRHALNFVCPDEIDLSKIPLFHGRPERGLRGA